MSVKLYRATTGEQMYDPNIQDRNTEVRYVKTEEQVMVPNSTHCKKILAQAVECSRWDSSVHDKITLHVTKGTDAEDFRVFIHKKELANLKQGTWWSEKRGKNVNGGITAKPTKSAFWYEIPVSEEN